MPVNGDDDARDAWLAELEPALQAELRALSDVRDILRDQRVAVAASDREGVEASVDLLGRALLGLESARRHRRAVLDDAGLGGIESLDDLEHAGVRFPVRVRDARAALRRAATEVARDLTINQRILRGALEAGEAFLQHLFATAADPLLAYGSGDRPDPPSGGVLLNRTV